MIKRILSEKDMEICECGDFRHQHENGTGKCKVCSYSPVVYKQPCMEFRNEKEPRVEQIKITDVELAEYKEIKQILYREKLCPLGEEQGCPYEPLHLSCDDCQAQRVHSSLKELGWVKK